LCFFQNAKFFIISAVKEMLPDILQHLGPKQLGFLKELMTAAPTGDKKPETISEVPEDDDIPQLT
jgi:hypothetical protein